MRATLNRALAHRAAGPLLALLLASPGAWLVARGLADDLGANPAEALIRGLGDWALRLLCLGLAVTPLRVWSGLHALGRHRRAVGLATFAYASLHWSAYAWLDQGWDWPSLWQDIGKRPFILVGTLAWLLLLPLAATSADAAVRALGGRAWRALHRTVYLVAPLAWLHHWWMKGSKNDLREVWFWGAVLALLLGWRLWRARPRRA